MKKVKKCLYGVAAVLVTVIIIAKSPIKVLEAAVTKETVYIAGASDCFPVEYYDQKEKQYKGIVPELLQQLEKEGNYQFIHYEPGMSDKREKFAQNHQVDMYIGFDMEQVEGMTKGKTFWKGVSDVEPNVAFYYTDAAGEAMIQYVEGYLASMTQAQLNQFVVSGSSEVPKEPFYNNLSKVLTAVAIIVLLLGVLFLRLLAKREKAAAEEYKFKDAVTGFGNIEEWKVKYNHLVHEENRSKYCVAYMELQMKNIFKTYGYEETEEMLRNIAQVLDLKVGTKGCFARFYEVGFVLLLPFLSEKQLSIILEDIKQEINKMLAGKGKEYVLMPYFGVYLLKQDDISVEKSIYYAEATSDYAKENDNLYVIYNKEIRAITIETYELEREAIRALNQGELQMYIQPVIRLEDAVIIGGETSVRWEHPTKGMLRADRFLPIYERNHMRKQFDIQMFEKACQFQRRRMRAHKEMIELRCVFSLENLFIPDFVDKLLDRVHVYGLSGEYFSIEIVQIKISEANMVQRENLKNAIKKLGANGFGIYMGNLYINDIFEEFVKNGITRLILDEEVVYGMNEDSKIFIESLIRMGHMLQTKMVAQGVENAEQEKVLKEAECDFAQGNYYYPWISSAEFNQLLEKNG